MLEEIKEKIAHLGSFNINDEDTVEFLGDFYNKIGLADTAAEFYLKAFKIANSQRALKNLAFAACKTELLLHL